MNKAIQLTLLAVAATDLVASFSVHLQHKGQARWATALYATEKLVFKGDYTATTDALPATTTRRDISEFFSLTSNRDIFLSAGGTRKSQEVDMTPEFKQFWEDVCEHFSSDARPHDDDKLVATETEVKFPGMKLTTTSVSGIKEIYSGDCLKGWQVFLVAEKSTASGAPPAVWLYNKLTGNDKQDQNTEFNPPKQTKARSIISVTELKDGALALTFELNLEVTVEFPAVLIKILPTSKEKMEEQGSTSILKAVSKDVEMALQVARDKFVEQHATAITS